MGHRSELFADAKAILNTIPLEDHPAVNLRQHPYPIPFSQRDSGVLIPLGASTTGEIPTVQSLLGEEKIHLSHIPKVERVATFLQRYAGVSGGGYPRWPMMDPSVWSSKLPTATSKDILEKFKKSYEERREEPACENAEDFAYYVMFFFDTALLNASQPFQPIKYHVDMFCKEATVWPLRETPAQNLPVTRHPTRKVAPINDDKLSMAIIVAQVAGEVVVTQEKLLLTCSLHRSDRHLAVIDALGAYNLDVLSIDEESRIEVKCVDGKWVLLIHCTCQWDSDKDPRVRLVRREDLVKYNFDVLTRFALWPTGIHAAHDKDVIEMRVDYNEKGIVSKDSESTLTPFQLIAFLGGHMRRIVGAYSAGGRNIASNEAESLPYNVILPYKEEVNCLFWLFYSLSTHP